MKTLQVVAALVQPSEYRFCDGSAQPQYDVSFQLKGPSAPLIVTVGETVAGDLIACTY
jgi:hypothetical protein